MARLLRLPSQDIIDGYKGTIDYYIHRGIPCARSWPKSPGRIRSAAVMAQWQAWRYGSREWTNLSDTMQTHYRRIATNSGLTGRDMFMRAYLRGLYYYPTP